MFFKKNWSQKNTSNFFEKSFPSLPQSLLRICLKELILRVLNFCPPLLVILKDTHREKAPPDKPLALTKSTNMGIWVVGTSDQLFIRGC